MKISLKSQKGSSTVLIALFMVALVVFALLSLTASASELKLARRNAETNRSYYSLDSEGTRFLHEVKSCIKEAKEKSAGDTDSFFTNFEELLDIKLKSVNRKKNTNAAGTSMTIKRTIVLDDKGVRKYLEIQLSVREPLGAGDINQSCSILEWRLWQEPFEYSNTIDLWEGMP